MHPNPPIGFRVYNASFHLKKTQSLATLYSDTQQDIIRVRVARYPVYVATTPLDPTLCGQKSFKIDYR